MVTGAFPSSAEVLRLLPASAWSRTVGKAAGMRLPSPVVRAAVAVYARALGVRLTEAEVPRRGFGTFGEFFARRLLPGSRSVDRATEGAVVCPCDGTVLAVGLRGEARSEGGSFEVKGRRYSSSELTDGLAPWLDGSTAGGSAVIYLSPADYHRVHSPVDGVVERVRRIPGTCMPVNRIGQILAPWAVVRNERVVFDLDAPDGRLALVMVGALGVCGIEVVAEAGTVVARGDEIGVFNLGSTVVLLWAGGTELDVRPGQRVLMGQRLARRSA